MECVDTAPRKLQIAEYKLRGMTDMLDKRKEAVQTVEKATEVEGERGEQTVQAQEQSVREVIMSQAQAFIAGRLFTLFLLFSLVASGNLFLQKLVSVLP